MKVMLAYYNDLTVFLSTIFKSLGFEIDYMGKPNKKTIELAVKHSPETWCFDAKLILGQIIEGARRGNNILTMPGAWGGRNENCLLGYLCRGVMKNRAEYALGKKIRLWNFNINPVEMIFSGYLSAYKNIAMLRPYTEKWPRLKIIKAFVLGVRKMKYATRIKEIILNSPGADDKKKLFSVYNAFMADMIYNADTKGKTKEIYEKALRSISRLKKSRPEKRLKIGVVGDYDHTLFSIYPFFDIEAFLLSEGVCVKQPLSFYNYYSFLSPLYNKENRRKLKKLLPQNVTGSDAITILSALYLKDKVDGIIHIGTFSCTPEEVANEVLTSNKKLFPPILSLSYDAHTNEENMKVRVEAFVDMLENHKRK